MIMLIYLENSEEILEKIKTLTVSYKLDEVRYLFHKLKGSSGNVRDYITMKLALEGEKATEIGDYEKIDLVVSDIYKKIAQYRKIKYKEEVDSFHDK